jgi:Calpain family cysteine protease
MSKTHILSDDDDGSLSGAPPTSIGTTGGLQDVIYLREPGCAAAVSIGDVSQGSLGDCFLLAAMDEIARQSVIQGNPSFIPSIIHPNPNGTESVVLYQPHVGLGPWTPFIETVSNVFDPRGVNAGARQAVLGNQKEIWPQIIEKAYAQSAGGYDAIGQGGFPTRAMSVLTGDAAFAYNPVGLTVQQMMAYTNNNDLIVFDTQESGSLPYGLVADHSYAFAGYSGSGANTKVLLQNPWGFDNPAPIPITAIAAGTTGIDVINLGHVKLGAGHGVAEGAGMTPWFG